MNQRLSYLDCLRGMVMLMVVFCHTCGRFCLDCKVNTWVGHIFEIMMLPGFFFVSGWFTHASLSGVILKRLTRMLLPTVLMFLIYVFLYWGDMENLEYCALGEYKFGYWFTFALFLMNIMHWGVGGLIRKNDKSSEIVCWGVWAVLAVALIILKDWDWMHNQKQWSNWFCLRLISMYFPFYLMGMLCKHKEGYFHRMVNNEYVIAVMIIAFVIGTWASRRWLLF